MKIIRIIMIFAAFTLGILSSNAWRAKQVLKTQRVNTGKINVTCSNGGDPAGSMKTDGVLSISCATEYN